MTKSSTPSTPERQIPPPTRHRGRAFLVFIFRLLLLGVSAAVAGLVGIAIAQLFPSQSEEMPLLEKFLRRSNQVVTNVQDFPQRLSEEENAEPILAPIAQSEGAVSPAPAPERVAPLEAETVIPAPPAPAPNLTEAEQQELLTELTGLQAELDRLGDRTAELEQQLGTTSASAPLERRLASLEQQIDPNAAPPEELPEAPAEESAATAETPASESASPVSTAPIIAPITASAATSNDTMMVTLPSDVLFEPDSGALQAEGEPILNSIIEELQRFPGATIRVASHVDIRNNPAQSRTLSFEQAQAVQQYLAETLADRYHWVTVGYGQSRPLVNSPDSGDRQRNRRIEIAIDPR